MSFIKKKENELNPDLTEIHLNLIIYAHCHAI